MCRLLVNVLIFLQVLSAPLLRPKIDIVTHNQQSKTSKTAVKPHLNDPTTNDVHPEIYVNIETDKNDTNSSKLPGFWQIFNIRPPSSGAKDKGIDADVNVVPDKSPGSSKSRRISFETIYIQPKSTSNMTMNIKAQLIINAEVFVARGITSSIFPVVGGQFFAYFLFYFFYGGDN